MVNTKNKSEKVRKRNPKKFTKNISKLQTNSQIFQAKVTAEVDFLKTLPEDEEQRQALLIVDMEIQKRKIKERNAEERKYSGPPLITDREEEEERLDQLSKKFDRESAQRSKVKKDAKRIYLKERADLNTKKTQNIKFITQKKLNQQLREEVADMTQKIQKVQKTLENNIKKYQSVNDELMLYIVDNTCSLLNSQSSAHNEENIENFQDPPAHITTNQELDIINFPIADPCNNLDDINDLVHNELYDMNLIDSNMDDYILNNGKIIGNIKDLIPNEGYDMNLLNSSMDDYILDNGNIIDNINDLIPNDVYYMDLFSNMDDIHDNDNIGTIMLDINELFAIMPSDTY